VAIARGAVGLDCSAKPYKVNLATGEVVAHEADHGCHHDRRQQFDGLRMEQG